MIITLFTSRVILQALGVEDFGINNVVAGTVTMFSMFSGFMSAATSRYLNFAMGKGDKDLLYKTFSASLLIYVIMVVIIFVFAETVGLWFINNKLVISESRLAAANWIFQFSIVSCVNALLATPYNASIISHEKMSVYAYVSIIEAVLKLAICYMALTLPGDRLIVYGFLYMIVSLIVTMIYRFYCIQNFVECKFHICKDKAIYKSLISYSIWNLLGTITAFAKGQGLNVMLNIFFNPSINAARGISYQINSTIVNFSNNFYTAVRPQVTKYYAKGQLNSMYRLVFFSSKMMFCFIFIVSLPIIIETPYIVNLWLGQLPEKVVPFTRLIVTISAINGMSHPLMTTAQATGKVAFYQSSIAFFTIMILPISYVLLELEYPAESVYIVSLAIEIITLFSRLYSVKRLVDFPVWEYIKQVFVRSSAVIVFASIAPVLIYLNTSENVYTVMVVCFVSVLSSAVSIYFIGLNFYERKKITDLILHKISKK